MAKINWTFQDEIGTNLNRYRATNVNTGEEITFDLLRDGNIQVVGTPLNADTLNSLIESINACYDVINPNNTRFIGTLMSIFNNGTITADDIYIDSKSKDTVLHAIEDIRQRLSNLESKI